MDADALNDFLRQAFPDAPPPFVVTAVAEDGTATLQLAYSPTQLRPGGTLSGPTLMGLADTAGYAVVLAAIGPVPLAVTSTLTINFLRKPPAAGLLATGELLKLGRRQAVVDVRIRSAEAGQLVAQASVTYAIPSS